MKKFDIPENYRSSIISEIKKIRKEAKNSRNNFLPTELNFGPVKIFAARHLGFCYGVENAIETAYKIMNENPDKKIYLLSEMIHNQRVNQDLQDMGIQFIQDTKGNNLIPWDQIKGDDIVIIPAFGTTVEIENFLKEKGIPIQKYDTTCPFVGRVWKRSQDLGKKDYTVIIHGKLDHEETRATFSHTANHAHSLVIQNMEEAKKLAEVIRADNPTDVFDKFFGEMKNRTPGFNPAKHLKKVGVVNQTTMLATETKTIAKFIKTVLAEKYNNLSTKEYFADTKDTLCYATSDNQDSLYSLLDIPADLAIVVGGYKSANTNHLVELCENKLNTFYINSADKIISKQEVVSFNRKKEKEEYRPFLPEKEEVKILVTSGASCPDAVVEEVIQKILSYFEDTNDVDQVLASVKQATLTPI